MGWAIIECPCCGARMELGKHISIQTNADRIRSMSDEELACLLSNTEANFPPNVIGGVFVKLCETAWLDWLRQEARDG